MIFTYLSFSLAIIFLSFIVGMAIHAVLKNTEIYKTTLSSLNFIKREKLNKWIGVGFIQWVVKNTPFKFFNQQIKLKRKMENTDLLALRNEMTNAEIGHLIGFAFVCIFACMKFYKTEIVFGLTMMLLNVLMNLYPSLLQQQHKRRIDKLIKSR